MEEKDRLIGQRGLGKDVVHPRATECFDDLYDLIKTWTDKWLGIFDPRDLALAIHSVADEPGLIALEKGTMKSFKDLPYPG